MKRGTQCKHLVKTTHQHETIIGMWVLLETQGCNWQYCFSIGLNTVYNRTFDYLKNNHVLNGNKWSILVIRNLYRIFYKHVTMFTHFWIPGYTVTFDFIDSLWPRWYIEVFVGKMSSNADKVKFFTGEQRKWLHKRLYSRSTL